MLLDKKIPISFIVSKIRWEIITVLIIALVVYYVTNVFRDEIPDMPLSIPAFLGTAISVILSFKLGQSYDRWWEARKIWGSIVNDSRTFILQLQSFLPQGSEQEIREIAKRHIAWCYALGRHLRGLDPLKDLDRFVDEQDLAHASGHQNKPLALLQLNNKQIAKLKSAQQLDVFTHVQLSNTVANFSTYMGMAERIKNTVFPSTYRLFLHFFIYIFVVTLSIALRDVHTRYEVPLLMVISAAFFLLEKSATQLQDPFSNLPTDTPVTAIATTIETNIKQLVGLTDLPEPTQQGQFYVL